MVTPVEEPQEEQDDVVVPEIEVEEISVSSISAKSDSKFDFSVENTDRPDLVVYTVSTKPVGEEHRTLTILAPSYGVALEIAGINKNNTVKVSEVFFEG
jgi:hypothetical protein|tara:strand:+ start:262 stop:558 length:297 start_codon:yes stop_codon:yes gene_type:complete